jgi:hypothetical protein
MEKIFDARSTTLRRSKLAGRTVLSEIFLEHPRSVGETYLVHQRTAFGCGLSMIAAGLACVVHGLIPAMFLHTGSDAVLRLYRRMVVNRAVASSLNAIATRT